MNGTATQTRNLTDWQRILMRRKFGQNRAGTAVLVPHGKNGGDVNVGKAVMDMGVVAPRIDVASMSAWATITTPAPDRSEDVVEPMGIMLDNYRKNPVVLWDHGFGGINVPIGKSEDSNGELAVVVSETGVDACCFFAQGVWEACQIFELIVQKIVRATSIGFRPLEAEPRTKGLDRPGLYIPLWELFEWSWVVVPDNPDAIAKVLDGGKLAGRAICEPLLKSLTPHRPGVKPYGRGLQMPPVNKSLATGNNTKAEGEEPEETGDEGGASGGGEGAGPGSTPAPGPNDAGPDDNASKAEGDPAMEGEEEVADPMKDMPLGAQVLTAAFAGLSTLATSLTASVGPLEHPEVKEFATGLSDAVSGLVASVEETYGKTYPDAPKLKLADPTEEAGGKTVAKFLANGAMARSQLSGIGFKLKGLLSSPRLKPQERDIIKGAVARLDTIVSAARKSAPKPEPKQAAGAVDLPPDLIKSMGEVVNIFKTAATDLQNAIPANRRAA